MEKTLFWSILMSRVIFFQLDIVFSMDFVIFSIAIKFLLYGKVEVFYRCKQTNCSELDELDEQNASQGINLDDAVIAVWKALVYLDYKKLNTKDSKWRYVAFMK